MSIKRAVLHKPAHIILMLMVLFIPLAAYAEAPYDSTPAQAVLEVAQQGPLPSPAKSQTPLSVPVKARNSPFPASAPSEQASKSPAPPLSTPAGTASQSPASPITTPAGTASQSPASPITTPAGTASQSPASPITTPAGTASQSPASPITTPAAQPSSTSPVPSPSALSSASPSPSTTMIAPDEFTVMLNGRSIFNVRANSGHTAQERAGIVEERLQEVLQEVLSSSKEPPSVDIIIVDNTPVIESEEIYILSVTNSDADPVGTTVSELAAEWRDSIEKGLRRAWREERSDFRKTVLLKSLIIIAAAILLNVLGVMLMRRYLKITGFFFSVIIWLMAASYIMWLFPSSRPWGRSLLDGIIFPAGLLLLLSLVVFILFKPVEKFVDRYIYVLERIRHVTGGQDQRLAHRMAMLRIIMGVAVKGGLILVALLIFVNSLKINITTALTGAGVIGVGIGLATQDLMKDFVAGFFIALEDQFAVGDVIRTGTFTGTVEEFTFRITRLRDTEGKLITIPNSAIRTVENLSSGWSQVDFNVSVAYRTDLARAMNMMLETAQVLKQEWPEIIIEEPLMLGVDELGESAIRLRMLMKTVPLEQWRVKRELQLRIKNRFDQEGIEIPFPQQTVWVQTAGEKQMPESDEKPGNDSAL